MSSQNYSNQKNSQQKRKKTNNRKVSYWEFRVLRSLDPGILVFFILAAYLTICCVLYLMKPHVSTYEVQAGNIAADHSYTGMIIRSEQVVSAGAAGYITYYARESDKIGAHTSVYALDQTGKVSEMLSGKELETAVLTGDNLRVIDDKVDRFYDTFSDLSFFNTYSFKQEIENETLQLLQQTLLENTAIIGDIGSFQVCTGTLDGIISYQLDGYESVTAEDVTDEMLTGKNDYNYQDLRRQNLVEASDPVYKVITDDEWSLVIETDDETAQALLNEQYVEITLKKDKTSLWGQVSTWKKDGHTFVGLAFTNSMIRYAQDRYLDLSFELDEVNGLKVPKSAISEQKLFVIPVAYLSENEMGELCSVNCVTYGEDGSQSITRTDLNIAYETEEYAYINQNGSILEGTSLAKTDSEERYTIGKTEKLTGVYNYNKGYAVFCPINILFEADEYCIIESQTKYGLSKYDYIVLDSSVIKDAAAIYQ